MSELEIGQTLHGYRGGHRLLQASRHLSSVDRQVMLELSDSADAFDLGTSESLLVGYPLPDSGLYVLATTWSAPEIERPGCVWTHSLILDADAVAIEDPRDLVAAFRRPDGAEPSGYDSSLRLRARKAAACRRDLSSAVLPTVLWAVYEPPEHPVDLRANVAGACAEQQRLLLEIWAQQWPALRRTFSFAQSPRAARHIGGRLFDIQITERPQTSTWERRSPGGEARTVAAPVAAEPPVWTALLAADVQLGGDLREYLRTVGQFVPPSRSALWACVTVWAARRPDASARQANNAVRSLVDVFPEPDEGLELKAALLGAPSPLLTRSDSDSLRTLLAIASDGGDAFSAPALGVSAVASRLAVDNPRWAGEVVRLCARRRRPTATDKQLMSGVASGISDEGLSRWSSAHLDCAAVLINRVPSFSARSIIWHSFEPAQLWPRVQNPRASRERRMAMLVSMIRAGSLDFVCLALDEWDDAAPWLLTEMNRGNLELPPAVMGVLDSTQVISWLKNEGPSPRITESLLAVWDASALRTVPESEWTALAREAENDATLARLLRSAADGGPVAVSSLDAVMVFEGIARSERAGELSEAALRILEGPATGASGGGALDAGAALLSRAYRRAGWCATDLLSIADADALRRVLACDPDGRIVRCLVTELENGMAVSEAHRDLVYDTVVKSEDPGVLRFVVSVLRKHVPWL